MYVSICLSRCDLTVWNKRTKSQEFVWFWNFIALHILSHTAPVFPSIIQGQYKTACTLFYMCFLWDTPHVTSENIWDNILNGKHYRLLEHLHPLIVSPPFSISNKHIKWCLQECILLGKRDKKIKEEEKKKTSAEQPKKNSS